MNTQTVGHTALELEMLDALRLVEDALRSHYPRVPAGTPTIAERRRKALQAARAAIAKAEWRPA